MIQRIRFQGAEYLLVDGAIALEDDYRHGRPSFAHLYPNGEINRHGTIIGHREDIEILGDIENGPEIADDAFENLFDVEAWMKRPRQVNDYGKKHNP